MKTKLHLLMLATVLCLVPITALSQSTMEFQSGTNIEVTTGADICADNVMINGTYSGSGTQCGGALPVEMVSMTAQAAKSAVTLSWTTASETDNYGFEIERRVISQINANVRGFESENDGVIPGNSSLFTLHSSQWSKVGFIQGSGSSTSQKDYAFTDEHLPAGRYAYRIRQIDQNGSFAYTDAAEVEVGLAPKEFTLSQNYPNPFNPTTTIDFTLQEDGHVMLKLYDMTGSELVTLLDEERKAGYYQSISFDASRLGSGTYFYRIDANGRVMTKKMMLVK